MHFDVPSQLHSDHGPQFESKLMSEVCTLLGIQKAGLHCIICNVMVRWSDLTGHY